MNKRKPGRPRVDPTSESRPVTVSLSARMYDEYARKALARGVSLPALIRAKLAREKIFKK